jgi:hypothetical protein
MDRLSRYDLGFGAAVLAQLGRRLANRNLELNYHQ